MPTIRYDLEGDASDFSDGMAGAANALGGVAAGALAAGAAVGALLNDVMGRIDQVNTFSKSTGLSAEKINGLRLAASAANKDVAELIPKDLAKKMSEAAAKTGPAALAFKRLGVEAADGNGHLRSADTVLDELLDGLADIPDPATRSAVAVEALGEEGKNMLSAFDDADGLNKFVELGNEFGTKVGPDAQKAAADWWGATANLNLALEDAGSTLAMDLAPKATKFLNSFTVGFVYLAEVARGVFAAVAERVDAFGESLKHLRNGEFRLAGEAIEGYIGNVDFFGEVHEQGRAKAEKFWRAAMQGAEDANEEAKDAPKWIDFAADANEKAAAAEAARLDKLAEKRAKLHNDKMKALEKELDATERWAEREVAAYEKTIEAAEKALEDKAAMAEKEEEDREAANQRLVQEAANLATTLTDMALDVAMTQHDAMEEQRDDTRAWLDEHEGAHGKRYKAHKEQLEWQEAELQERKKAARAAFYVNQAAAIAEIAFNTAMLFTALSAALAPIALIGAPAAAGLISVPMGIAQAAIVAGQSPPAHDGATLGADEVPVGGLKMRTGESFGVLNQRATESGGAAVVDRMNRDQGGGGAPPRVVFADAGRVIGEALLREVSRGGPIADAFGSVGTGIVDPYGGS